MSYTENVDYAYIVVVINGHRCYISKDLDYTDDFREVLRFDTIKDGEMFMEQHNLKKPTASLVGVIEAKK